MQQDFRSHSHFSQRSEALASMLGVSLGDLPSKIGISERMFYGYRSGKYPISEKAWRKLEALEQNSQDLDRSFRTVLDAVPPVKKGSDVVSSAQQFAAGVQSMMQEMAEMRQRLAELEKIVRKGPRP